MPAEALQSPRPSTRIHRFEPAMPTAAFAHAAFRACAAPLDGVRVLVTAPRPYAARVANLLIDRGARPILCPTIVTRPLSERTHIDTFEASVLRLCDFQIVAFMSRYAIVRFRAALYALADGDDACAQAVLDVAAAAGVRFAALGRDASAMRELLGRTADVVPLDASPTGLVNFLSTDPSLAGATVLCPVPVVVGMEEPAIVPNFLRDLAAKGFVPCPVPVYETVPIPRDSINVELGILARARARYVAISSAGEAQALRLALTDGELEDLRFRVDKTGDIVLVSHGPYTGSGIRKVLGVEQVSVSTNYSTFDGMIDIIADEERTRNMASASLLYP